MFTETNLFITMSCAMASISEATGSIALVIGATGIVGRGLISQLLAEPIDKWPTVYAVTRRSMLDTLHEIGFVIPIDPALTPKFQRVIWLTLDLSDNFDPDRLILEYEWFRRPPMHLFYAGLASVPALIIGSRDEYDANVALLYNARLHPSGTSVQQELRSRERAAAGCFPDWHQIVWLPFAGRAIS